jgi:hypothetical protein
MPWYKNTLFVITADHTSSNIQFPEYRTRWGFYSIPIFFFKPDNSLAGVEGELAQQTDIMPSVLGYLHSSTQYLLVFDGARTLGLYDFKNDELLLKNLMDAHPDRVASMETTMKAVIQQYNNRMIEDRLTVMGGR